MRTKTVVGGGLFVLAGILLYSPEAPAAPAGLPETGDAITPHEVLNAAEPAFREWIAELPDDRITDFGFRTRQEVNNARLIMPVPNFFPVREQKSLTQSAIEEATSATPQKWIVPVAVGDRIACQVVVNHEDGKEPVAAEFGRPYAANRLDAGYRLLGWPDESADREMRLVSFFRPVYELLLANDSGEGWIWINLTGTTVTDAQIMSTQDIHNALETLSNTKPAPILGTE